MLTPARAARFGSTLFATKTSYRQTNVVNPVQAAHRSCLICVHTVCYKDGLWIVMSVSVRVYAVIISKYATKIVGTQKRQVACVHGMQDQKQSTFNTFKPAQ